MVAIKKRLILLILPIITVFLESLPNGVVMYFMSPPNIQSNNSFVEYFSYFEPFPIGYAEFSPFLTAVLSCVILLLLFIYCLCGKAGLLTATKILLYITIIISLAHLIMGLKYFTILGGFITVTLVIELIMLYIIKQ